MNANVNGVVSGIGVGDSITQIEIVWRLNSETQAAAAAAGRGVILTSSPDIAAFIGSGYFLTSAALLANTTYTPSVRITENMSGGGSQTGAWANGTDFYTGSQWWTNEMDGSLLPTALTPALSVMSNGARTNTDASVELVGDGTITFTYQTQTVTNRTASDNTGFLLFYDAGVGANNIGNEVEIRFKINTASSMNFGIDIYDDQKIFGLRFGRGTGSYSGTTIKLEASDSNAAWHFIQNLNPDQWYVMRVASKSGLAKIQLDGVEIYSTSTKTDPGYNEIIVGYQCDYTTGSAFTIPYTQVTVDYMRWKTDGATLI